METNKVIIYTIDIKGHFLEYFHHVYDQCRMNSTVKYIMVLPCDFEKICGNFVWANADNILFDFISKEDCEWINNNSIIRKSLNACKYLRKKINEYHANRVFSLALISLLPFAPFYIPRKCQLSGIIYMIYLYTWKDSSIIAKSQNIVKYLLMSLSNRISNVFILNDSESALRLNEIYHVKKYTYIPDPYVPIEVACPEDIRGKYLIGKDKTIFAHIGAMNLNKGTVEILESLKYLSGTEKKQYVFFFAGRVDEEIKQKFNQLVNDNKDSVKIIVKDEFCSYQFFASLCIASDAILTPYKRTSQSSGLIGYASQFGKPVIAPSRGLLGRLVEKYKLGILIRDCTPQSLCAAYKEIEKGAIVSPTFAYCNDNSVENFRKVLNDVLI